MVPPRGQCSCRSPHVSKGVTHNPRQQNSVNNQLRGFQIRILCIQTNQRADKHLFMNYLGIVLLVLALSGTVIKAQTRAERPLSEDDEIRRVLIEHIRGPWVAWPERYEIICVSVDGKDPSKELLIRLQRTSERFKPGSACFIDENDGSSVKDKKTRKTTVMLSVNGIKKANAKTINAEAGSYLANMGADGCTYILKLENGVWNVDGKEKCWIS